MAHLIEFALNWRIDSLIFFFCRFDQFLICFQSEIKANNIATQFPLGAEIATLCYAVLVISL